MTAYYFRVMENNKPNGWIGFAMAPNMKELFWVIDEFVDPYAVEIQTAKSAGYCFQMQFTEDEVNCSDYETSDDQPFVDEGKWRSPVWVTDISFCSLRSDL